MKKRFLLLLLPAVLLAACSKAVLEGDGCITVIKKPLNPVGDANYAKVTSLFAANNMSTDNLSFYRVIFDDVIPLNGQSNVYNHFFALQYVNGLPVLNGDIGFHFKDGVFSSSTGIKYNGVSLNAKPALSTQQIRKLFLEAAAKDGLIANRSIKSSCLSAEFGYYNLNLSSDATAPRMIKVWKVTPVNAEYPVAYIRDDNAEVLSYFNGIMTFN